MLIDSLAASLERSGALSGFWGKLDAGSDATLGIAASARPLMVAASFVRNPKSTLVVVAGEDAADTFARSLAAYVGKSRVLRFPERSDFPFNAKPVDAACVAQRMEATFSLLEERCCIVVASARALVRALPPASERVCAPLVFVAGQELACMPGIPDDFEAVPRVLEAAGYRNTGELEGPGTFCVRGGTIDVFAGNMAYPVRLDFFGDELDEIRRIVPATGQTIAPLPQVEIYPVREYSCAPAMLARAKAALAAPARTQATLRDLLACIEGGLAVDGADALLPYLYNKVETLGSYAGAHTVSALIEPRSLFDDATHAYEDIVARAKGTGIAPAGLYVPSAKLNFGQGQRATYVSIMRAGAALDAELTVKRSGVAGHPDKLFGRLSSLLEADFTVVFSAPHPRARHDIELSFSDHALAFQELINPGTALRRKMINVSDVDIPLGLVIPAAKLALVALSDTHGAQVASKKQRQIDITQITFPYKPGDYVVHAAHGVAFFRELVRREIDGTARDYLLLEYAQGDKLYVPVEQLDRVTRYVGPEGASPRLTRLNTSDWSRACTKARKATKKLAFDLVDVYARRAATQGFAYGEDTAAQREMEEDFPYEETPDQLAAINDVRTDMQSTRPMDRLICGDVGFGKTEVALRAAFRATQAKKQVMVLCPTTILAQQHYTSFRERFEPYGVRVDVLSRFRTPAEQAESLDGFARGVVDVLVGTHRLLSRDVNPKDLGLVIIDEEQRFGVGHKEQLKNLRESIDVLTLSATPIPRTLQMSLSGVRDMSLILTPPDDRRPVKVHVGEWDPDLVSAAIRRELARGGQVYYVSNRVKSIEEALERVHAASGEARVGVAHGQMGKDELERVMEDFSAGQLDVLVATTIIESGIDNPHTNTLVIEDAQRLGLAQMYQLKGRVGRSAVQAYAYFMFPDNAVLTDEALARLTALDEHTDLGSGMRIAMRDLEIRGAGSLLGAEQSGNMSAVGFDLFAQMLSQALTAAREGNSAAADALPPALSDITVNLPGHTYLPEEYIPDADVRVMWYRRIAYAATLDDVCALEKELAEKAPAMPDAARNLFAKAHLRALAASLGIQTISLVSGKLTIEPLSVSRDVLSSLRRRGVRYNADKRKLSVPARIFELDEDEALFGAVARFLHDELAAPSELS